MSAALVNDAFLAAVANAAAPLVGAGLVLWFIKRGFAQLEEANRRIGLRLDAIERAQAALQLAVARECATKAESDKIWDRVDDHESRLSRLEAVV
ncbi:MAG: hypothetical protein H0S85_07545 [Desulfovibrionaceae bacterium]|nr:hypothetical protein [Desulfovibrionaceae bacterium]